MYAVWYVCMYVCMHASACVCHMRGREGGVISAFLVVE